MRSKIKTRNRANSAPLGAIVLAAGASSRMGRLKPLLPLCGITSLERSIAVFREAGIQNVWVVLGCRAEELRHVVERCGAHCIDNPRWEEGMYSSVVAGASAIARQVAGAFVMPADIPLVRTCTIRQLADAFLESPDDIVYPVFDERRGHPPLIARAILKHIAGGAPGPLSAVLATHEARAREVMVADEAIHLDMDWPSEFDALRLLAAQRDIPSEEECEALFAEYQVPEAVIRHAQAVADIAVRIADAMIAANLTVNRELVHAAALLHDVAKGHPRHAEVGASMLRSRGMIRVAEVVGAHTEILFQGIVDERAIVYLADKLIAGEDLVGLDERFRNALERFVDCPDALAAARRRKADAERIAAAIESMLSMPLTVILRDLHRDVFAPVEVAR